MSELYKKLVGSHKKQADAVIKLKDTFATSWWVSLDPGSNSCGYALWNGLELVDSGSIATKGEIGVRLSNMSYKLEQVLNEHKAEPVITVVEMVRTGTGHHYLTWSAGSLVGTVGAKHTLEVSTGAWKKVTTAAYVKGDEADAYGIGTFCVELLTEKTIKGRKRVDPKLRARRHHTKRQSGRNTSRSRS